MYNVRRSIQIHCMATDSCRSQEERNRWIKVSCVITIPSSIFATVMFHLQKLNKAKTENSEHFTINKRSKYATVLNDPEAHSELM